MSNKIKNKNKKALSEVVSTVLVLLLALVAISTLVFTMNTMTKRLSMSPEISCTDIRIKQPIVPENVCYSSINNELQIKLARNLQNVDVKTINIIADSSEWQIGGLCETCVLPDLGNTLTYYIALEQNPRPNEVSIVVNGCFIESVQVRDC